MADPTAGDEVVIRPLRWWHAVDSFEVWIAAAAVYTGLTYLLPFLHPAGNARLVAMRFPQLATMWSVLYALGGAAILAGLIRRSPRLEGLGLHLLGSGLTVSVLAGLAAGAGVLPTLLIQGGAVVATALRLLALRRLP